MSLSKQEYEYIRSWARERSAISLQDDKEYLVKSRLMPVLRRHEMRSIGELIMALSKNPPVSLEDEVVDAMTTNETFFFRDVHPFELIRGVLLPKLEADLKSEKKLSIWSAACSSGQEIYSIAMLIREYFPQLLQWDLQLHATDLSPTALEKARSGIYSDMEAKRGLDERFRERYFTQLSNGCWQIKESIRNLVTFKQLNFIQPWPDAGKHHLVLIRNVLIYFDLDVKRRILERIRGRLDPRGYMMLGTSETTLNIDPGWEVRRGEGRSSYFVPRT